MKSARYPNLHKYKTSKYWVFRKYSKEKRQEFVRSTKIEKDEAKAYRVGLELFNDWLGTHLPAGKQILIKDLARALKASKFGKRPATIKSFTNQCDNHVIPGFGNLRPDQVTSLKWDQYDSDERRKGRRTRTSHTRQALLECLRRAFDEGMIKKVPRLKNHDGEPPPPTYLDRSTVRAILHEAAPTTKLLAYILWKQGARPGEIVQYRWDMIRFDEDVFGVLRVPAAITKTGRARELPLSSRVSRVLQWILAKGHEWDLEEASMKGMSGRQRLARRFVVASAASPYLFPSKQDPRKPMTNYKTGWLTACEAAKQDHQIYSLRDTFITNALKRGKSATFIAKYVDNSSVMIERKYAVAEREAMKGVAD